MPIGKVKEFLEKNGAEYETIVHAESYTAQETAAAAHVPGGELAKTVMVTLDGRMAMVVLPASRLVDFDLLKEASGAEVAELAGEEEFEGTFPECETGAMPPFGNLWGIPVYVAESLAEDETIAFRAGSHHELIRLAYADFERLVKPTVARLT